MHDPRQIRALAERLLVPTYAFPVGRPQIAHLLVGEAPAELPLDPPVPPGGLVAGSVARHADGRLTNADVLLDLAGEQEAGQVLAFYERELPARGWAPAPARPSPLHGGFQPGHAGASRTFCRGGTGPWVSVTVGPPGGLAEVRLHVELTHPGPCTQPPGGGPPGATLLPPLQPPEGVSLRPGGGSFGGDQATSVATAESELSAADLERRFAEQLRAAAWERVDGGADGPLAWSRWRLPQGGDWHGSLIVLEAPVAHQRSLMVRAELAGGWGGSWSSLGVVSRRT